MLKVEITGNDIRELYFSALTLVGMMAQGGNTMFAAPPGVPDAAPAPLKDPPPQNTPGQIAEPVGDVTKLPAEFEKARKSTRKAVTINAKPIPAGGDEVPDMTGGAKPSLTLEDCRARTKAVIKRFEDDTYADLKIKRADATQEQIDAVMSKTMAFMMDLFKPFGIKKAPDLKPDQFVEYMAATGNLV